jgi:hypothetical protein
MSLITATGEVWGRDMLAPAVCAFFALVITSVLIAVSVDAQQFVPVLGEAPYP